MDTRDGLCEQANVMMLASSAAPRLLQCALPAGHSGQMHWSADRLTVWR